MSQVTNLMEVTVHEYAHLKALEKLILKCDIRFLENKIIVSDRAWAAKRNAKQVQKMFAKRISLSALFKIFILKNFVFKNS